MTEGEMGDGAQAPDEKPEPLDREQVAKAVEAAARDAQQAVARLHGLLVRSKGRGTPGVEDVHAAADGLLRTWALNDALVSDILNGHSREAYLVRLGMLSLVDILKAKGIVTDDELTQAADRLVKGDRGNIIVPSSTT